MDEIWTVFERESFIKKDNIEEWKTELIYYKGDLTNEYNKLDWRFCEVKSKRKTLRLIKVCLCEFPIKTE